MFAHTNLPGYKWTNCLSQVGLPISLSLAGAIGICTSLCQLLKLKTYSLRNCGASTFHHGKCKLKLATQSSLTLCDPMDCSPPGSSVHGILQARILEWVAISFSRGSSQPRDQTQVTHIVKDYLPTEPPGKPWRNLLPWRKRQTRGRKREAELGTPFSMSPLRYSLWLSCSQGLLLFLLQPLIPQLALLFLPVSQIPRRRIC